jgi:hypothetical protein
MAAAEPPASRRIRLFNQGGRLVFRQSGSPDAVAEPLPRLPLTWVNWCDLAAERFYRRQRRCLLVLLMLDTGLRRWTYLLPAQRCSRYVARWDVAEDRSLGGLPEQLLLAGSFQSAPPGHLAEAMYLPPPFDGIHLVNRRGASGRAGEAWSFVRREGELYVGDPAALIGDDIDQALADAAERIRLDG